MEEEEAKKPILMAVSNRSRIGPGVSSLHRKHPYFSKKKFQNVAHLQRTLRASTDEFCFERCGGLGAPTPTSRGMAALDRRHNARVRQLISPFGVPSGLAGSVDGADGGHRRPTTSCRRRARDTDTIRRFDMLHHYYSEHDRTHTTTPYSEARAMAWTRRWWWQTGACVVAVV